MRYLSVAAHRVFRDPSWWWRALALSAIALVPLVGGFFTSGYGLVLARDAAWDVERGLPTFDEAGEFLRRGWDAFVVALCWVLAALLGLVVLIVIGVAFGIALEESPFGAIVSVLITVVSAGIYFGLLLLTRAAVLRSAIYCKASAGLTLSGVLGLIRRAPAGYFKMTAIWAVVGLVEVGLLMLNGYAPSALHMSPVGRVVMGQLVPLVLVFVFIPVAMFLESAWGVWLSDTDVAAWPPLDAPRGSARADGSPGLAGTSAEPAPVPVEALNAAWPFEGDDPPRSDV